jgi:hypothetical protein
MRCHRTVSRIAPRRASWSSTTTARCCCCAAATLLAPKPEPGGSPRGAGSTKAKPWKPRRGESCARRPGSPSVSWDPSCSAGPPCSTSRVSATGRRSNSSACGAGGLRSTTRTGLLSNGVRCWVIVGGHSASSSRPGRPSTPSSSRRSSATSSRTGPGRPAQAEIGGTGCGGGGPTYWALGRMSRLSAACSRMCAHQPMTRLAANVGVNSSRGMPQRSMTMPA